jgi:chromosome segregation ATPase
MDTNGGERAGHKSPFAASNIPTSTGIDWSGHPVFRRRGILTGMDRILILLLLCAPAFSQTDTQLTQALLNEIRGLRQDLQTTAITIQRVQIVMYRLQAQSTLMSRAAQRLDEARNRCTSAQSEQRMFTTQIQQLEEHLRSAQDPMDRKSTEDRLRNFKSNLENMANEETQCRAREADADAQFRAERARMTELEDQLDKLDKALASIGSTPAQRQ